MRIAHVVTYVSEDGAFGGPVTVALGQAAALADRGHAVTVYAASPDREERAVEQDGYVLRTFPSRWISRSLGFAGLSAPSLTRALVADARKLDVAHIHIARDLVTLPAARALRKVGVKYVAQPHGMIDRSSNPLAVPVDKVWTRACLRGAVRVLTLTSDEEREIREIEPAVEVRSVRNGVQIRDLPAYGSRGETVLFLARLHPRKRPQVFVAMAELVARTRPTANFVIAGADEGEGTAVDAAIERSPYKDRIRKLGAVKPADVQDLMRSAAVYVLPSFGEVFPMTILEAFQAGTPVVTTSSLGIASECERYGAAIVTDGEVSALAAGVDTVLGDTESAEALRHGAAEYLRSELDVNIVAQLLEKTYAI